MLAGQSDRLTLLGLCCMHGPFCSGVLCQHKPFPCLQASLFRSTLVAALWPISGLAFLRSQHLILGTVRLFCFCCLPHWSAAFGAQCQAAQALPQPLVVVLTSVLLQDRLWRMSELFVDMARRCISGHKTEMSKNGDHGSVAFSQC